MEKNRQIKMMFIIALVLSITAMTLGFAAFSTTLNISSSASVTPNSDAFNIKIYGLDNAEAFSDGFVRFDAAYYTSLTTAVPNIPEDATNFVSADNAIIDGYSINFNIFYNGPGDKACNYYFMVHNDSEYAVKMYIDTKSSNKKCTALEGAQQSLVNSACSYIVTGFGLLDENGGDIGPELVNSFIVLDKGEKVFLRLYSRYKYIDNDLKTGVYVDGPFKVEYKRIDFKFTTAI